MTSSHSQVPWEPATNPGRFLQIPAKLYGHPQAIHMLLETFDQLCRGLGKVRLAAGHSGVGETALVQEVREPVGCSNGFS